MYADRKLGWDRENLDGNYSLVVNHKVVKLNAAVWTNATVAQGIVPFSHVSL